MMTLTYRHLLRYVFSKCYREDPRAAALREDAKFRAEVEELKAQRSEGKIVSLWFLYGFYMVLLWFYYDFTMVLLWFYGNDLMG